MGQKSSIKRLPKAVRDAVNLALANDATLDEVVAKIKELGHKASRSAVGRHAKQLRAVGEKIRRSRELADALVKEIGPGAAEGKTGRLLVEILQNVTFKVLMADAEDDDAKADPKDIMMLGRALKDMASAQKIDVDRELRVRKEFAADAAKAVETIAKAEGMDNETVQKFRAGVLGLVDR